MFNIVICDDNEKIIHNIKNIFFKNINFSYDIIAFNKLTPEFEEYIVSNMISTIYILDIELNDIYDGYDIARKIKKLSKSSFKIIFLTSHIQTAFNAYKYKLEPADFIEKSNYCKDDIVKAINKSLSELQQEKLAKSIIVSNNRSVSRISLEDILYIEKIKASKLIKIQGIVNLYKTNSTINKISSNLDERFFLINRGLIVNKQYISSVTYQNNECIVTLFNNTKLYGSKKRIKELLNEL